MAKHTPESIFYLSARPLPCFDSPLFGYTSFMRGDGLIAILVINAEDEVQLNVNLKYQLYLCISLFLCNPGILNAAFFIAVFVRNHIPFHCKNTC